MNKFLNFIMKKSAQYTPEIVEAQAKSHAIMAKPKIQAAIHGLAVVAMLGAAPLASAAGFEETGKSMANTIFKAFYGIVGVVALIVGLWQAVECWSGKRDWMDFGKTMGWIAIAAATPALVAWIWKMGQSFVFGG